MARIDSRSFCPLENVAFFSHPTDLFKWFFRFVESELCVDDGDFTIESSTVFQQFVILSLCTEDTGLGKF